MKNINIICLIVFFSSTLVNGQELESALSKISNNQLSSLEKMYTKNPYSSSDEEDLEATKEETLKDQSSRTVLSLPHALAPNQAAILPLLKKDGLPECAKKIYNQLKFDFQLIFDEKDAIGKRYRRQDAIGTPICITIDHQTLIDNTVTLRDRDSMDQNRVEIKDLSNIIKSITSIEALLKKI